MSCKSRAGRVHIALSLRNREGIEKQGKWALKGEIVALLLKREERESGKVGGGWGGNAAGADLGSLKPSSSHGAAAL